MRAVAVAVLWMAVGASAGAAQTAAAPNYAAGDPVPRHETFRLRSAVLGEERVINVYTPPGHGAAAGYPVVYMPDGGMREDFPHVANTLDSLVALGRVPPLLLVGIENTERRRDLTGPTVFASDSAIAPRVGGSGRFRAFIRDELMPEIRRRYRAAGPTAIIGESLAGLFIVETFLLEPGLFDGYVALSPSLWWDGGRLARTAGAHVAQRTGAPGTLYLAAADEPNIVPGAAAVAAALREHAPAELRWRYEPRPDLRHGTIYRALAADAFVALYSSPMDSMGGDE